MTKRKDPNSWKNIPNENKYGSCYEVAAKIIVDNMYTNNISIWRC